MVTKTCNTCNLTLDISNFGKTEGYYRNKCKQCRKNERQCEHRRRKQYCCEGNCNGSAMCKHKIRRTICHKCGGKDICKHGIQKGTCRKCEGYRFCKHSINKYDCKKCGGSNICEHGNIKRQCKKCDGSSYCEHKKRKSHCKKCGGCAYCEHGNIKQQCIKCGGSMLCIHCKHILVSKKRYVESLDKKVRCCIGCFYHYYPNDEIPRRYKKKQHYFNEKLIEEFGADFFQYDKRIKCGCSGRMPDWFIDCFKYSIIIELDEDQHKYTSCDDKRMMELFKDLGNRPLVLIRINPDKYKGKTKERKGCFDFDERNILICNEKKFYKRFNILVEMIRYYLNNEPEKEITKQKLFFDRD